VSQSEGGFELVHQSVVVMPHWIVTPDADGVWKVVMRLSIGNPKTAAQAAAPHVAAHLPQGRVVSAIR
jgi:alpha-amylase